jgi:creatinine amidohydrolase/Fe(II)-dependent formamide hydrolase-like protein
MPWWSSFSRTGVHGRPTLATAEKGKTLLDAAVDEIAGYVRELKSRPLPARRAPSETPTEG